MLWFGANSGGHVQWLGRPNKNAVHLRTPDYVLYSPSPSSKETTSESVSYTHLDVYKRQNAYANVDIYSEMFKSSVFSQEHNVSVNGGSEKVTYYASFNYLDQGGLLEYGEDGLSRYNVAAKINANITKWLKFNYSTRFTRNDVWRPTSFNSQFYDYFGRMTWPNMPMYDPNGYPLSLIHI